MRNRSFEFAMKVVDGVATDEKAYPDARIPEYSTLNSAGADFFAAEDVVIPSIWKGIFHTLNIFDKDSAGTDTMLKPSVIHTGIKANMYEDEVLELYNRSSNPKKLGLVLANSVGVVDADYYGCKANDGEIMFSYWNFKPWDVKISKGDKIGQGVFKKFLRPEVNLVVSDSVREGGHGSTGR